MTYDGWWEMREEAALERQDREDAKKPKFIPLEYNHLRDNRSAKEQFADHIKSLSNYWVIVDDRGKRMTKNNCATENDAWQNLVGDRDKMFDKNDYIAKGCKSKYVDIALFRDIFNQYCDYI